jgi:hypothetical protein
MKTTYFLLISFFLLMISCKRPDIASNIPPCIYKEITDHKNDSTWYTGNVEEYSFQDKIVYAFNPDNRRIADGATIIKDKNCNVLCSLGGFGGPQINKCNGENFWQSATLKRTIWKKK